MVRFEYKLVDVLTDKAAMESILNVLDDDGWIFVAPDSVNQTYIFQRPLSQ